MMGQQVEQAATYYRPVGVLKSEKGIYQDISDGVARLRESGLILYDSNHYTLFGAMKNLNTAYIDSLVVEYTGNNQCYFTGTVLSKSYSKMDPPVSYQNGETEVYDCTYTG